MTKLKSLQYRASEVRSALAAADITQEKEAELLKEYGTLETEIRRQMVLDDEPAKSKTEGAEEITETDTADTEYRNLVEQVSVGKIFHGAVNGVKMDGAEAEIQKHLGLGNHVIPLDALRLPVVEERAVTPAPDTTGLNQQSIEQNVFPNSVAGHLQIPMPTVPVGTPLYPDVATNATVTGPHTDSTSVAETTGSFNTVSVEPARFQASFFYRRTDAAKFAGLDNSLRENLNMALSDALDKYILTQLHGSTAITKNTNPTAAQSYADLMTIFAYGRVEGAWVSSPGDLRIVSNSEAYSLLATTYSTVDFQGDALAKISGMTGGLRVSKHIPAVASKRATSIIRLGSRRDAVAPIWEGVSLIVDPYTRTKTGEIVITAVMLANFTVLRAGGFYLAQTYHA